MTVSAADIELGTYYRMYNPKSQLYVTNMPYHIELHAAGSEHNQYFRFETAPESCGAEGLNIWSQDGKFWRNKDNDWDLKATDDAPLNENRGVFQLIPQEDGTYAIAIMYHNGTKFAGADQWTEGASLYADKTGDAICYVELLKEGEEPSVVVPEPPTGVVENPQNGNYKFKYACGTLRTGWHEGGETALFINDGESEDDYYPWITVTAIDVPEAQAEGEEPANVYTLSTKDGKYLYDNNGNLVPAAENAGTDAYKFTFVRFDDKTAIRNVATGKYVGPVYNGAGWNWAHAVTNHEGGADGHLMEMVRDINSGIDAVDVTDAEAVYYNLQGVRVDNPVKGIFVKVCAGKTSKVVR